MRFYKCAKHLPPFPTRLAAILLLLLLSCCAKNKARGRFDGLNCDDDSEGGSGSAEEEQDWWIDNVTNGTELCSGVIEVDSSQLVYSAKNTSSGNVSY